MIHHFAMINNNGEITLMMNIAERMARRTLARHLDSKKLEE
jgi:hypothetical protein